MNACKHCGIEYSPSRANQQFCSISHAKRFQYQNGFKANTEKAHETLRIKGHYKRDNTYLLNNNPAKQPLARKKISESKIGPKNAMYGKTGELHHLWRGGKTKTSWKSVEYQRWRKACMRRDNYTCQECGDNTGGNLEVHHIKPRFLYPELTLDIENGKTLCKDCHMQTDSWGNKVRKLTL